MVSELAQCIIRNRAEYHHWSLNTYPGKIRLPKDIFHNLSTKEEALDESRRTYLSDEIMNWAKSLGKRPNVIAGPSVSVGVFEVFELLLKLSSGRLSTGLARQ